MYLIILVNVCEFVDPNKSWQICLFMTYLEYNHTPVVEICDEITESYGVRLLVKREDLNHSTVSGNKWWKLKGNLIEAHRLGLEGVVTFGGAYSNHIYATAATSKLLGIRSVGIIRGEKPNDPSETLQFAERMGMKLHFIQRSDYRSNRNEIATKKFPNYFCIPEGGTNKLAVESCREFGEIISQISFDRVFIAVGTGGTMAGLISGLPLEKSIHGVAVLKDGSFLSEEMQSLLPSGIKKQNWDILTEYHHGGYAKTSAELLAFIQGMKSKHKLPLDYVYTGKMMFAIYEEMKRGAFKRGETILAIHTGGLQGNQLYTFT